MTQRGYLDARTFAAALIGLMIISSACNAAPKVQTAAKPTSNINSTNTPETAVKVFLATLQSGNYDHISTLILPYRWAQDDETDKYQGLKDNYGLTYLVSLLPKFGDKSIEVKELIQYASNSLLRPSYDVSNGKMTLRVSDENPMFWPQFVKKALVVVQPTSDLEPVWQNKIPSALQKTLVFPLVLTKNGRWLVDVFVMNMSLIELGSADISDPKLKLGVANTKFIPHFPNRFYRLFIENDLKTKKPDAVGVAP